jgi:hypothetical protein
MLEENLGVDVEYQLNFECGELQADPKHELYGVSRCAFHPLNVRTLIPDLDGHSRVPS